MDYIIFILDKTKQNYARLCAWTPKYDMLCDQLLRQYTCMHAL